MSVGDEPLHTPAAQQRRGASAPVRRHLALLAGGTDGNEVLTTLAGLVLFVMLAAIGLTIVRIGQLLWLHLFIGVFLLGPVLLKLSSTGYRFVRYYSRNPRYVEAGPPWMPLRMIAPIVAASTVAVFITGLILLFGGPSTRHTWLLLHKVGFFVWIAFTALHVAGHIPEVGRVFGVRDELVNLPGIRADLDGADEPPLSTGVTGGPGAAGRWLAIAGALVLGLVLAVALIPEFHVWTTAQPLFHHFHDH